MMSVKWTDEQIQAITKKSGNGSILVSAAAGSGKTAVLVERIITKVINERVSISNMLVVTFTDSAASEMRDKIIRRMYKAQKSADKEDLDWIKGQIKRARDADILTIDAFCMRVLKNNFYVLGVDPNFRILDKTEAILMQEEVAEELFNELYNEDNERFLRLLNLYASNRDDNNLSELVKKIYEYIQSFANPNEWLNEKSKTYSGDINDNVWFKDYIPKFYIKPHGEKYYQMLLAMIKEMLGDIITDDIESKTARDILTKLYGEMCDTVYRMIDAVNELRNAKCFDDAHKVYVKYIKGEAFDKLTLRNKPQKDIGVTVEEWRHILGIRNRIKGELLNFLEIFKRAQNETDFKLKEIDSTLSDISWLVTKFSEAYLRAKDIRNVKEFSDIEHLVCKLFTENEDIRREFKDKYEEILIDEYQDTNGLQDTIFETISRDRKNMFMVGDLKQSIYRFRGGDPTIFKSKSNSYIQNDNLNVRINLSQNFRSRQEILRSVNDVFINTMTEYVGDVEYKNEQIVRHQDATVWDDDYKSELCMVGFVKSDDSEEKLTAMEVEAEFIARRINELKSSGFLIDDDGVKRPVKNSDIAILMRSVKSGVGDVLMKKLSKYQISSYVEIEDYFERREIRLMLSLISVIDNHLQDIPLLAVMRSPIGNFSENDIALLRLYSPDVTLYEAVINYRDDETDMKKDELILKMKCKKLASSLKRFREYIKRKTVANLIWTIYEETGIYDFVGVLEDGEESQANLRLLYERAKKYEQSGFKGLFNFIRYIERLETGKNDLSSANLADDGHDVVRIMTMHKSKGLEFPVVFLAGLNRRFHFNSPVAGIYMHKDLGFGVKYVSEDKHYIKNTIFSELVKEQNNREDVSEEMRILYVAMTRAKDKLIAVTSMDVTPSEDKTADEMARYIIMNLKEGVFISDANCYGDWLCKGALNHEASWKVTKHLFSPTLEDDTIINGTTDITVSDELRAVVDKSLSYEYAYQKSGYIPAKISVTALKQMQIDEAYEYSKDEYDGVYMEEVPEFMREEKTGAQIGTAHHQIMAYLDIDAVRDKDESDYPELIKSEIKRIIEQGELDLYYYENEGMRDTIIHNVCGFLMSKMGKRMLASDKVYRERPFQIEIGADEYDGELSKEYSEEKVILQGVIDCFFKEGDKLVLFDYKTDKVKNADDINKISDKYRIQLELYKRAIEKITGEVVGEKYLYLFSAHTEIKI